MAGTTFGKYQLVAELGHGGMADVFLAVIGGPAGSGFSKLTVIKRLRSNLAEDPEFVAMLIDEARIAARLNHPNVVQTNEVGTVEGQYFIAMEYLDGQPLHRVQYRVAKETDPKTVTDAMQYLVIADALAGLHHAHELSDYDDSPLQIVHRDVTPHNIFVTYDGQVKMVDFGIAKAAGRASETRQGIVKGKVRYMAPEQAIGQAVDRRADIFCMGIVLWEVAVGRRLWKDKDDLQIVQALIGGEFPSSPSQILPDVPDALDRICTKALARSPNDRYQTAEAFRLDLEQYLADAGLLLNARRGLGNAVGVLFKDKRAEIKQVIESQLSQLANRPNGDLRPAFIALESSSGPSSGGTPPDNHVVSVNTTAALSANEEPTKSAVSSTMDQAKTEVYARNKRSASRFVIPGLLVLLTISGLGWVTFHRLSGQGSSPSAQQSSSGAAAVSASASGAPDGTTTATPPNALASSPAGSIPAPTSTPPPPPPTTLSVATRPGNVLSPPGWRPATPPGTTNNTSAKVTPPAGGTTTSAPPPSEPPATPTTSAQRKRREIDKSDPWSNPP